MKNQKGAALVVVLSFLTVSLMLGLSSMQSSHVYERLASNFKAQTETLMNAETGVSEFFANFQQCGDIQSAISAGFGGISEGYELVNSAEHASTVDVDSGNFQIYMRGYSDGGRARALVRVDGLCEVPLSFLRSRGAFVCPVGVCGFEQGASVQGGISGFDHTYKGPQECNFEMIPPDQEPQHRAGAIFTDVDFSSQGYSETDVNNLNVEGSPDYLAAIEGDDGIIEKKYVDAFFDAGYMSDLFDDVDCGLNDLECRSDAVKSAMEVMSGDAQAIVDAVERASGLGEIQVVNAGETFTVNGRFDGVILMNGGKLVLRGNSCVVGAVVGSGSAESTVESSGTPSVFGTMISNGMLTFTGKGRPDVSYSSEVLSGLDDELNLVIVDFDFVRWEDYLGGIED